MLPEDNPFLSYEMNKKEISRLVEDVCNRYELSDVPAILDGLKAAGIIRRIGGVINPRGLGWHSTLCAASVPEDRIEDYAEVVNAYPEVTHNYVRTGDPNCWFTLIAANEERSKEIIREIEERLRIKILDLPAKRIFKIKVSFNL